MTIKVLPIRAMTIKTMRKKGQVVIILIVGFIVALGLLGVFWIQRPGIELAPPESDEVVTLLSGCLHRSLEDLLLTLSVQGGYVFLPNETVQTPQGLKGIFSRRGRLESPALPTIQQQSKGFIQKSMSSCVNKTVLSHTGISWKEIPDKSFEILFTEKNVQAVISRPVMFSGAESQKVRYQKSIEPAVISVRYKHLFEVAQGISRANADAGGGVDLSFLAGLNLHAEIAPLSPGVNLLYLTDAQSTIKGFPYVFTAVMVSTPSFPMGVSTALSTEALQ